MHNMNAMVEHISLDLTLGKTAWCGMSFGGIALHRVMGKPCVSKGGQNVVLLDLWYCYNSCLDAIQTWEKPFTQQGPAEVKSIDDLLDPLIEGWEKSPDEKHNNLSSQPPTITYHI